MSETDAMFVRLYEELRAIAQRHLQRESPGHPLQPGDLVHEAYLRLHKRRDFRWESQAAFAAAAAATIRRVLVDHARRRNTHKRGGNALRLLLEVDELLAPPRQMKLEEIDAALKKLSQDHPSWARVVELRVFSEMSIAEVATALGLSAPLARRRWNAARAWLRRHAAHDRP